MARKTEDVQVDAEFLEAKDRRVMLQSALRQIREQGYGAQINLMVAEAQTGKFVQLERGLVPREEHLRALGETVANAHRAMKRLQDEIAAIPAAVPDPDDG